MPVDVDNIGPFASRLARSGIADTAVLQNDDNGAGSTGCGLRRHRRSDEGKEQGDDEDGHDPLRRQRRRKTAYRYPQKMCFACFHSSSGVIVKPVPTTSQPVALSQKGCLFNVGGSPTIFNIEVRLESVIKKL